MAINPLDATAAYKQIGSMMGGSAAQGSASSSVGAGQSFGDLIKGMAEDTINDLHGGEKAATQAVSGSGNLANVVTAIDNAELLLTQITALRDKALAAYQQITSTAI